MTDGRNPEDHLFMGEGTEVKKRLSVLVTQLVRGRGALGSSVLLFHSHTLSTTARQLPSLPHSFMQNVIICVRHCVRSWG